MKLLGCAIFTLFLMLGSGPVLAQTQLRFGDPVREQLTSKDKTLDDGSYYHLYEFRARRGQRLVIELSSSDFEPYLTLFDRDGTEIISTRGVAANANGPRTARIEITAPYMGMYLMRVNSVRYREVGNYSLVIK